MTTVEKLKAKILDLAIRGKLVPQDPNDEPASVLLERIKAEKAKLVKAKKIKKDKNPSEIVVGADGATYEKFEDSKSKDISDELPFDLPQGWAWCRIRDVTVLRRGEYVTKKLMNPGNIPVILGGQEPAYYCDRSNHDGQCVVISRSGASAGFASYWNQPIFVTDGFLFECPNGISTRFLYHWFKSFPLVKLQRGTGMPHVQSENLNALLFALPPSVEQQRIVEKIEELFACADAIGESSEEIAKTAQRIDKKILDLAIRGQLVPQDPSDEPASELVKRIEAAKRVNAGGRVSSRAASDRPAYEIDPPFDIPDSWEWVKLKDLGVFVGGHTPSLADPSNWENGTVLWVTSKDMKQKYIEDTGCKVSAKGASELHLLPPGSLIMVTRSGILRRTFPVALAAKPLTINQDQRALEFYDNAIGEYVYCCIRSFESTILRDYRKTGTTVESIIWEKFIDLPIPLPPLAEQKRIVAKVDELKRRTRTLVAS